MNRPSRPARDTTAERKPVCSGGAPRTIDRIVATLAAARVGKLAAHPYLDAAAQPHPVLGAEALKLPGHQPLVPVEKRPPSVNLSQPRRESARRRTTGGARRRGRRGRPGSSAAASAASAPRSPTTTAPPCRARCTPRPGWPPRSHASQGRQRPSVSARLPFLLPRPPSSCRTTRGSPEPSSPSESEPSNADCEV